MIKLWNERQQVVCITSKRAWPLILHLIFTLLAEITTTFGPESEGVISRQTRESGGTDSSGTLARASAHTSSLSL